MLYKIIILCYFILPTVPLPPSNLSVTPFDPQRLLVSWTPTGTPERYIIYYTAKGENSQRNSVSAGPGDTSVFIPSVPGRRYSISIVARTGVPSEDVGPVNITASMLQPF